MRQGNGSGERSPSRVQIGIYLCIPLQRFVPVSAAKNSSIPVVSRDRILRTDLRVLPRQHSDTEREAAVAFCPGVHTVFQS